MLWQSLQHPMRSQKRGKRASLVSAPGGHEPPGENNFLIILTLALLALTKVLEMIKKREAEKA